MSQIMVDNQFFEEALFSIANGYCKINLTRNLVMGSMYQVIGGVKYNLNKQLGIPENASLTELVSAWSKTIPEEGLADFLENFDRERLLERYHAGEQNRSYRTAPAGRTDSHF